MNLRLLRLSIFGVAMGLGIVGALAYYLKNTPLTEVQDTQVKLPDLGGPFRLVDQFGRVRTNEDFRGKYMLIYFGYTFCPDVCPLGLQNISAALENLGRDVSEVVPLFITVDPERDTVENMKIYAGNWHSSFVMLTGTQKQLDPVLQSYKVYAQKAKPDGTSADYLMDHSALVYLVNREGKFVDFFPHTTEPQKMADRIRKFLLLEKSAKRTQG